MKAGLPVSATATESDSSTAAKPTPASGDSAPEAKGRRRLRGCAPVALQVHQVVEDVDRRRAQAERQEGDQRLLQSSASSVSPMRREQRQEDQQVLQPLVQPHRAQPGAQPGPGVGELALDVGAVAHAGTHAADGVDHDGAAGALPDRQVVARVAGVVEAALAEALDQHLGLAAGGDVVDAVARDHLVEEAEVLGHVPSRSARPTRCTARCAGPRRARSGSSRAARRCRAGCAMSSGTRSATWRFRCALPPSQPARQPNDR